MKDGDFKTEEEYVEWRNKTFCTQDEYQLTLRLVDILVNKTGNQLSEAKTANKKLWEALRINDDRREVNGISEKLKFFGMLLKSNQETIALLEKQMTQLMPVRDFLMFVHQVDQHHFDVTQNMLADKMAEAAASGR